MQLDIDSKSPEGMLTLLSLRGVGAKTAIALAKRFGLLSDIADADAEDLREFLTSAGQGSVKQPVAWSKALSAMDLIISEANQHGVRVVSCFDEEYPELMRNIPDQPAVIYVKGTLKPGRKYVACVGTREPSRFGAEVARRITGMLAEKGWGIVSGLALGMDSECHTTALASGGYTVAILANGLDSIYPKKNEALAREILDKGGALISEQPVGTKAFGAHLVQRDRLQSGMSLATFVMQTDIVGGTMHTVRFTLQQGRLLFVPVPTEKYADEEKSRGIRALAELSGNELAEKINADEKYREFLNRRFGRVPPAIPIRTKDEYEIVLRHLSEALTQDVKLGIPQKTSKERLLID